MTNANEPAYLGGCDDAKKHFKVTWECCSSCHDEWDNGYGDPSQMYVGERYRSGYFDVCCAYVRPALSKVETKGE